MLVWEMSDMLDLSNDDHYALSQILDHQSSENEIEDNYNDYFSITTENI